MAGRNASKGLTSLFERLQARPYGTAPTRIVNLASVVTAAQTTMAIPFRNASKFVCCAEVSATCSR
jgi:hypothetical protein